MLHSIGIIAVAAIVTLFIRAIPFVLFGGKERSSGDRDLPGKSAPTGNYGHSRCILCEGH